MDVIKLTEVIEKLSRAIEIKDELNNHPNQNIEIKNVKKPNNQQD